MSLQGTDIADLIKNTINDMQPLRFTDIALPLQQYVAASRLLKKDKVTFEGAPEFEWSLMTGHNESAQWAGLYQPDVYRKRDVMIKAKVGWKHINWHWLIDHREVSMNSGNATRIINQWENQRQQAFISSIEAFEAAFWNAPVSGSDKPFGLTYYVVKSSTDALTDTTADGFNGTVPSGFTTVANISPTTYPRWRNYADIYVLKTKDDLIRRWKRAMRKTDFKSPMEGLPTFGTGDDYAYYMNETTIAALETLAEAQNESIGLDLAPMTNQVTFFRNPCNYIPYLDSDLTDPIYGVNWGQFKTAGLPNEWMRETVQTQVHGQHNMSVTFTDCSLNWFTWNRRRHFVLSTGTTMYS